MIERISTPGAPTPAGHYSQATRAHGFVFVAGQLPIVPGGERRIPEGIEAQTRQALANVAAVLAAAGSSFEDLVSVHVYVSDVALWGEVDRVYGEVLGPGAKPARAIVPSGELHHGALLEISAVAVSGG